MIRKLLKRLFVGTSSLQDVPPKSHLIEFSAAQFNWQSTQDMTPLPLTVKFNIVKTYEDGSSQAELNIDHDGMRAQALVVNNSYGTTVCLGDCFWVPNQMKRKGLATAMVVAIAQAYHFAVYGKLINKRLLLEGLFVNEGAAFSKAICELAPKKRQASTLREAAVQRAQRQLSLRVAPARTFVRAGNHTVKCTSAKSPKQ